MLSPEPKLSKETIQKLENTQRVCAECGEIYGSYPKGHVSSRHENLCGICWESKSVTQSRDFWYFYKTLRPWKK